MIGFTYHQCQVVIKTLVFTDISSKSGPQSFDTGLGLGPKDVEVDVYQKDKSFQHFCSLVFVFYTLSPGVPIFVKESRKCLLYVRGRVGPTLGERMD